MGQKRTLCRQTSVSDFFKISPWIHTLPPVLLDTGDGDTDDLPTVQEEVPPP
jgi:hypothetical protein